MANNVIFQCDGGLGKSIMATAILKVIKKQYKKANIIVVTGYPDVFIGNPNVNKVLHQQQAVGFYKNYIHNKDTKVGQPLKYSWTRDLPASVVNEVVSQFKNDYAILHIKREDQLTYENTMGALDSWRSIAIMLTLSAKRLLIDSSSMHIASALNLPSVVGWIGTNPKVFGYDMHNNIVANEPTKEVNIERNSYTKYLLYEDISTLPYNNFSEIFDTQKIINALK